MKAYFKNYSTNRFTMCRICNKQIDYKEDHVILGGLNLPKKMNKLHFHTSCLAEAHGKFIESLKE